MIQVWQIPSLPLPTKVVICRLPPCGMGWWSHLPGRTKNKIHEGKCMYLSFIMKSINYKEHWKVGNPPWALWG